MLETQFISFFIVLVAAVFFSALFGRLHLPWAIALIVGGIVIGPHSLDIFEANDTILFMGEIGVVFLMFMAGLEMRLDRLKTNIKSTGFLALVNGAIPLMVGYAIGYAIGLPNITSFLLGVIFISSSVAVVVPSLKSNNLLGTRVGDAIIGSTMIQDTASLLLLSVFFQRSGEFTALPLVLFYPLLFVFLYIMRMALPRLEYIFAKGGFFQQELRTVFAVLVGTVIIFELLGLHPIIAGFFAGVVLSDRLRSVAIREKLGAISYGVFIPIFFVVVGSQTDLSVFKTASTAIGIALLVVAGSLLSKLTSGWLAAKIVGFNKSDSFLIAAASTPQLSTTLAVVFSGFALGVISETLVASMVILSITTTLAAPLLMRLATQIAKPEISRAKEA